MITRKKRKREEVLVRETGKKKKSYWLTQQCQKLTALPKEKQMFSGNI